MRCCSSASGDRPRDSANHTSASAIGRMMNCGQDHALDDLVGELRALVQRLADLHQRQPRLASSGPLSAPERRRFDTGIGDPHFGARACRRCGTAPTTAALARPSSAAAAAGRGRRRRHSPSRPADTWKYTLSTSSARRISRPPPAGATTSLPSTSLTCCASTVTRSSSARSNG